MPFKTKRRKAAAINRHIVNFNGGTVVRYSSDGQKNTGQSQKTFIRDGTKITRTIDADYSFVKSELGKITLLAAIIIGLQIALKFLHLPFLG